MSAEIGGSTSTKIWNLPPVALGFITDLLEAPSIIMLLMTGSKQLKAKINAGGVRSFWIMRSELPILNFAHFSRLTSLSILRPPRFYSDTPFLPWDPVTLVLPPTLLHINFAWQNDVKHFATLFLNNPCPFPHLQTLSLSAEGHCTTLSPIKSLGTLLSLSIGPADEAGLDELVFDELPPNLTSLRVQCRRVSTRKPRKYASRYLPKSTQKPCLAGQANHRAAFRSIE